MTGLTCTEGLDSTRGFLLFHKFAVLVYLSFVKKLKITKHHEVKDAKLMEYNTDVKISFLVNQ